MQPDAVQTVVITGASRGIGAATARRLAAPDRHLVLVARSVDDLEELSEELAPRCAEASYRRADLGTRHGAAELAEGLLEDDLLPDILISNAGMSADLDFQDSSLDTIESEMSLNWMAPIVLCHTLLPAMRERGHGHFVVVGSLTALVPFPGNATYAATKAALLAFVRSLRLELSETDLHAGIVLPGYTRTAMTEKKESLLPRMEADEVAVAIERCIEEQRAVVVPGKANQLSALLFRVFPDLGERIVASIGDYLVPG